MTSASRTLAQFALELCFEDIPPDVIERACIIDTIGAARYGSRLA